MRGPIARGTIRTSFVLGLRLVVQAGTLLIVARMLGPDQFGAFAGIAALAVILGTLSTFGTHLVLLGEVSKEPDRREQVLPYAVPFTLLCGGVLLAVFLLLSILVLHEADISPTALIVIGVTELWLQPLFGFPAMEQMALGRTARSQLLATLPLALRLLAAAAVFLTGPGDPLTVYAFGYLAASIAALAIATSAMSLRWPHPRVWRLPARAEIRESAGYAVLNITAMSPAELDKTLATKLLPLASAGVYAAGARVIGAATLPVIAMMMSALPRLFREGQAKAEHTARLLRWIFAAALAYGLGLAALLWFIAPLFDWLFGAGYRELGHIIRWLCLAVPALALRTAAGNILMALGRPWVRVAFEVTGLIVLVGASTLFTINFGGTGMPLALASAEWVMVLVGWLLVRARIKAQGAALF